MSAKAGKRESGKVEGFGSACSLLLAACSLAAGCGFIPKLREDTTQFHTLTAPRADGTAGRVSAPRILVRRVEMPAYLQPKTIAVRMEETGIRYLDDAWWSEPLDLAIGRVVRERLALAGIQSVARRDEGYDYEIVVRVTRCEGVIADDVAAAIFRAGFELHPAAGGRPIVAEPVPEVSLPWDGRDRNRLVVQLGAAVAAFADRVGVQALATGSD